MSYKSITMEQKQVSIETKLNARICYVVAQSHPELTRCSIHCITEELESRPFSTENTSRHWAAMETNSETEIGSARPKRKF